MSLVIVDNLHFSYGAEELLTGVTLSIGERARLGVVGPNGTGKSTLLRLILGELQPDSGAIIRRRGMTLGYLPQDPLRIFDGTVFEAARAPFDHLLEDQTRMAQVQKLLETRPDDDLLLRELHQLQTRFEVAQGYSVDARVRETLQRMGFDAASLDKPVNVLSGGELSRLALCRIMLERPDLLMLDEPTNHLDIQAAEELESFLSSYPGAVAAISHDRRFLTAAVNEIVEIRGNQVEHYAGNYEFYLRERKLRHELNRSAWRRQQEEISRQEEFIRRNIAGQKTKQAKSRRKMLERLERIELRQDDPEPPKFNFGEPPPGNKEVIALAQYEQRAGDRVLFSGASATLYRGDKLGLVGANGSGKSTLLRAIMGENRSSTGELRVGNRMRIGYLDQKLEGLDDSMTIIATLREAAHERQKALRELIPAGEETGFAARKNITDGELRSYAARFLFFEEDMDQPINTLSGGERARLLLAKLLLLPNNLLILDEPTNHLDIAAREALELALRDYSGTLLMVSHDRFFMDRVVSRIWFLHDQKIDDLPGDYSSAMKLWKQGREEESARDGGAGAGAASDRFRQDKAAKRAREKRERRIFELENLIEETEAMVNSLLAELQDPGVSRDWSRLKELQDEKDAAETRLLEYMTEWETLSTGDPAETG
ncbi:MAG: Energy-dependent translational throttle protein EttA [Myxococcota bacterium]|nr:Energy-dependent translational throttle protein EttA [Myxococcota bacterium]